MKIYRCATCQQQPVYFDNQRCLGCGAALAFDPESLTMLAFAAPWGKGSGAPLSDADSDVEAPPIPPARGPPQ